MRKIHSWFSLVEIIIGILIVSIVMVSAFSVLWSIWISKTKLIERTQVERQAYFASERFFEMIKRWWTIDYEEYWNRFSYNTAYSNWHFTNQSGFWNYWNNGNPWTTVWWYGWRQYNCLSKNTDNMWTSWCLTDYNVTLDGWSSHDDYTWEPQRFTQYSRQFIDRNSDEDADGWDENGDGSVIDDDDDLFLWIGPEAFPNWVDVGELYLISNEWTERTLFRWNVWLDPDRPTWTVCTWTQNMTWTWCLWTIEFLKLVWEDFGYDHSDLSDDTDGSQWDGVIDTWFIHPDFLTGSTSVIADSNTYSYWQPIFPNTINVSDVEFYLYPNKDTEYSWRDSDVSIEVAPYLQLKMNLQPSWSQKRKVRWEIPVVEVATTIQLTDLDFR